MIHIDDAVSRAMPAPEALTAGSLLIPPAVVNNLGFSGGYWESVANVPDPWEVDRANSQLFLKGFGRPGDRVVDFDGEVVATGSDGKQLPRAVFSDFNFIDQQVQVELAKRGVL